jgi:hypothetical protein
MRSDSRERRPGVFVRPAARQRPHVQPDRRVDEPTVAGAVDHFLAEVDDGSAVDPLGRPYSPEAARELRWWLGGHVREALGPVPIADLRARDLGALVAELGDDGVSARRLRELAKALRAFGDHVGRSGLVARDPAEGLAVPATAGRGSGADAARERMGALRRPADRAVSLALGIATLALLVLALTFLAESL